MTTQHPEMETPDLGGQAFRGALKVRWLSARGDYRANATNRQAKSAVQS